jgi:hypothetical protein
VERGVNGLLIRRSQVRILSGAPNNSMRDIKLQLLFFFRVNKKSNFAQHLPRIFFIGIVATLTTSPEKSKSKQKKPHPGWKKAFMSASGNPDVQKHLQTTKVAP